MEWEDVIFFMQEALKEAEKAFQKEEVPVGAVVVDSHGNIIGRGHNLKESLQDPTAHAELIAIREACSVLKSWRLEECFLFSTLEPCLMCCGALIQARIKKLYYGAPDPKFGAVESLYNVLDNGRLNHRVEYQGHILADRCAAILKEFFQRLRK